MADTYEAAWATYDSATPSYDGLAVVSPVPGILEIWVEPQGHVEVWINRAE